MLSLIVSLVASSSSLPSPSEDRLQLTSGVGTLEVGGGIPGSMIAAKGPAFVAITGHTGDARVPVFVGTHLGQGRALAGGHEAFFAAASLRNPSNARFLANALAWLGGKPTTGLRVGDPDAVLPARALQAMSAVSVRAKDDHRGLSLQGVDVLCLSPNDLGSKDQARVVAFVRHGGGLLMAGPGWGWQQIHPDKRLASDHPGNRLLEAAGLGFAGGMVEGPFSSTDASRPELTTEGALEALREDEPPKRRATAVATIDRALTIATTDDSRLRDRIEAGARREQGEAITPTKDHPATDQMPFTRLLARVAWRDWAQSLPEKVRKAPTADDFPGPVPLSAPRVSRTVTLETATDGWQPTGLYAAPGETVTVTIPEAAVRAGLSVRVGAHTDELWHLDRWERFPQVSEAFPLRARTTRLASPFGGTLYLVSTRRASSGTVPVTIDHAVPAPTFALGVTSKEDWFKVKEAPAPWADLRGRHVSLCLPSSAVADLQDPEALMTYWDEVFRDACTLYAVPEGDRQERYCVDRQISAGYMHSGYPIMTGSDVARTFTDLSKLRAHAGPTWGFYHELGHNFQKPDWTFDGTGEVTNNLFSLYGAEKLNGATPDDYGRAHPSLGPEKERAMLTRYLASGARFEDWKANPFLALTMYIQLRRAFGWEAYQRVFAGYEAIPQGKHPQNDDQRRDEWMVRFSRAVGKNLGPFFVAWGVPTSEAARQSVADLPTWMPSDWPKGE